jgi:predicted DNA-binding transcriptional regulator YafY
MQIYNLIKNAMKRKENDVNKDISLIQKAAYLRYTAIDECLSAPGEGFTKKELQAKITRKIIEFIGYEVDEDTGTKIDIASDLYKPIDKQKEGVEYHDKFNSKVSIRQIEYDLNNMSKLFKFPFLLEDCKIKDGRLVRYKYPLEKFSIRNLTISPVEAMHLYSVLEMLSRLKGLPQHKGLEEAISSLQKIHNVELKQIVEFENSNSDKINNNFSIFYGPLYDAIISNKVIRVKWFSFKDGEKRAVVHPYLLKQYNQRWYLIGYSERNNIYIEPGKPLKKILNIALDRMIPFTEKEPIQYAEDKYIEYGVDNFYRNLVGVSFTENGPQKIKLKVTNDLKPYVESKPLHNTQTPIMEDNTFTITVHINYELRSLIRSHGVGLEVLEPQSLREEMKRDFETLVEMYNK